MNSISFLDTTKPILGYVITIAVILIISGISFLSVVSSDLTSSATTMASILIIIGFLIGVGTASKMSHDL